MHHVTVCKQVFNLLRGSSVGVQTLSYGVLQEQVLLVSCVLPLSILTGTAQHHVSCISQPWLSPMLGFFGKNYKPKPYSWTLARVRNVIVSLSGRRRLVPKSARLADFCSYGVFADSLSQTYEDFPRFLTHIKQTPYVLIRLVRHFFQLFKKLDSASYSVFYGGIWRKSHCRLCINCYGTG